MWIGAEQIFTLYQAFSAHMYTIHTNNTTEHCSYECKNENLISPLFLVSVVHSIINKTNKNLSPFRTFAMWIPEVYI